MTQPPSATAFATLVLAAVLVGGMVGGVLVPPSTSLVSGPEEPAVAPVSEAPASETPGGPDLLSHTDPSGNEYHAIPTDDPDDGRFLSVAGTGLSTLGNNDINLFIGVPAGRTSFELSVFDGDTDGSWDSCGGFANCRLVYRLYRDPAKTGTSTSSLVASWNSDSGVNDGWYVQTFATDGAAQASSGNYFYRLRAEWENPGASGGAFNNFKVRATAQVSIVPGQDFGFTAGPQNINVDPDVNTPDPNPSPAVNNANVNSYNGDWRWYFYQPVALTSITFTDGDADRWDDTDDFNTPNTDPDGAGEAEAEGANPGAPADDGSPYGAAAAVSPSIYYQITDPDGNVYTNNNPSGNREYEDYVIGPTSADATVTTGLSPGLWEFRVRGMDAHNFNVLRSSAEIFGDTDVPLTVNPAPDVYPDRTGTASAGDIVRYAHTVENKGSAADTYDLTATSSQGWTTKIYRDTNGNGVLDAGETETASTGSLAAGAKYYVIVEVQVPSSIIATTTDVTTLTASSTGEWALQDSATDTTSVAVNTAPTILSFTATFADEGDAVTLEAHASDAQGDALTYSFDFQDDGIYDVSGSSNVATYTWGDDHTGSARVLVSDGQATSTTTTQVIVSNVAPTLALTVGTSQEGQALTLSYTITDPGSDDETVTIDWGDGTSTVTHLVGIGPDPAESTDINPRSITNSLTHVYGDDATLSGSVEVVDDDTGEATTVATFVIGNDAPTVTATVGSGNEGDPISWFGSASDPGSDDLTFAWTFDDGTSETRTYYNNGATADPDPSTGGTYPFAASESGTHTWGDDATYTVTLTVADDDGGSASVTLQAVVANVPPTVIADLAIVQESMSAPISIQFDEAGSDDVTCFWVFELGPFGSQTFLNAPPATDPLKSPQGNYPFSGSTSPSHTYGDDGVYSVDVTCEDDDGGSTATTATVTVTNVAPSIDSVSVTPVVFETELIAMSLVSTDPGTDDLYVTWTRDFRPPRTLTFQNNFPFADPPKSPDGVAPMSASDAFSEIYDDNGIYAWSVTVTDDDGGSASASGVIEVLNVAPTFTLAPADVTIDEGDTATLSAEVSDVGTDDLYVTWTADFGAGLSVWFANDPSGLPDGLPSPDGTAPFSASSGYSQAYGDDGAFLVTAEVCDDDGACASATATVTVNNVAPSIIYVAIPSGDEAGTLLFQGRATDPGSDDLDFSWWGHCTGFATSTYLNGPPFPDADPSPLINPMDVTDSHSVICGDNGVFSWNLQVTDDDGGSVTLSGTFDVANLPPTFGVPPPTTLTLDEGSEFGVTVTPTDPGSDDLRFSWTPHFPDPVYRTIVSRDFYNDGIGPDPADSPDGTFPFSATDTYTGTYGDDCTACPLTVDVTDDDGGILSGVTVITVLNVAPSVDGGSDLASDEGSVLPVLFAFSDPGFDDPAMGASEDFTATVDWGDGTADTASLPGTPQTNALTGLNTFSPLGSIGLTETPGSPGVPTTGTVTGSHIYADNGLYTVTVTVCDDDGGCGADTILVAVANVDPTVSAGADRVEVESSTLHTFTFFFTDPGFDWPAGGTVEDFTAMIDWGYGPTEAGVVVESPGGPGTLTSGTITATHPYGDDGTFVVTVTVCDDDGGCGTDSLTVTVGNVAPTITNVAAYVPAEITLRVAGEKWHDVCLEVIDYGTVVTASVCVVRYPGSPDHQSATISGQINLLGGSVIRVYYTPDDDPVNGRRNGDNPVWVELGWEDGTTDRLFHNFNVQHPDTWEWTIDDLKVFLVGKPIHFGMDGTDPGSDDLTFTFEFGDGASYSETDFNDGVAADPDPSPEVNPMAADAQTTHAYAAAGTYTVVFRVADDDGGVAEVTAVLQVG